MSPTIEVSESFLNDVDGHRAEGESREEFLRELLNHYEAEGTMLSEGYGGEP